MSKPRGDASGWMWGETGGVWGVGWGVSSVGHAVDGRGDGMNISQGLVGRGKGFGFYSE